MSKSALETSADILSKSAAYIDALETRLHALEKERETEKDASVTKEAEKLAEAILARTGTEVDLSVAKKLASLEDKEVRKLINKLATVEEVESIGSARRKNDPITKIATANGADADEADEQLLRWCLS